MQKSWSGLQETHACAYHHTNVNASVRFPDVYFLKFRPIAEKSLHAHVKTGRRYEQLSLVVPSYTKYYISDYLQKSTSKGNRVHYRKV